MFGRISRFRARPRRGLWRNPSFLNLWAAESVSQVGAQITLIALPLAAALSLDASAAQMGILTAAGTLPYLLVGLVAGVWVDRLRRRPILIAADIGRAAVLLLVPLLWVFDLLSVELLYAVAFLVGLQALFFDVAYVSILPVIVRRDDLVEGNSKLQGSASVAQVAGPGIAGILVGLITAPFAILVNVGTYLLSAVFLLRMRVDEPAPDVHERSHALREIGEGLRAVFGSPILRPMAVCAAVGTLFGYVFLSVYILFMLDDLGFSSTSVGLVFSLGGLGALAGSVLAGTLKRRIGIGPTIILGRVGFGVTGLLVPLAVSLPAVEVPMVLASEFLQWLTLTFAVINEISLRQAVTPDRMLGRVTATFRFLVTGLVPLGSLLGGLLGGWIGLRETLVIGEIGMLAAGAFVWLSPLHTMREQPTHTEEPAHAESAVATAA